MLPKFPPAAQNVLILAAIGASAGAGGPGSLPGERAGPSAACACGAAGEAQLGKSSRLPPKLPPSALAMQFRGSPLSFGGSPWCFPMGGAASWGASSQGFAAQQRGALLPQLRAMAPGSIAGCSALQGIPLFFGGSPWFCPSMGKLSWGCCGAAAAASAAGRSALRQRRAGRSTLLQGVPSFAWGLP